VAPAPADPLCAAPRPRDAAGNASCRSAWWSVLRFGLSVICLGFVLSLLVLPWTPLEWWKVFRRCVSLAAALSLWLCIRRFEHRSVRSYGLPVSGGGRRYFVLGIALGLGAIGLLIAIGLATGTYRIDVVADRVRLWRTVLTFLPAAVLIGILEELVFRGFILQHLLPCSIPIALLVSNTLYALVHLKTLTVTVATGLELGGLWLVGALLSLSYLQTHQLYLAIGLHAALAYGVRIGKLLLSFPEPPLSWWFGTSRMVNGLVGWVGLLLLGALIVGWTRGSPKGGVRHGEA